MLKVLDSTFENEVVKSDIPVLVDFWASWCGPCKMVAPVLEGLDKVYGEKVKFTKVDVDENPGVSSSLRISSIPTIMIFKEGKVVDTIIGFRPKEELEKMINKHI